MLIVKLYDYMNLMLPDFISNLLELSCVGKKGETEYNSVRLIKPMYLFPSSTRCSLVPNCRLCAILVCEEATGL